MQFLKEQYKDVDCESIKSNLQKNQESIMRYEEEDKLLKKRIKYDTLEKEDAFSKKPE